MTEYDAYLFDLQGYLLIENALSPDQVGQLNAVLDRRIVDAGVADAPTHRFLDLLTWGQPYLDLIDQPTVLPYLEALMGPKVRLDHLYLDIIRAGLGPIGSRLHGGGASFDPTQYYRFDGDGMHCGLTAVAYNLRDVGRNDGGFGCVPGSHKSNLPFPADHCDMSTQVPSFVSRVTGPAGTAIVFTEALTHGTLPWTGAGERRTIFYKYSPHFVSWSANYPTVTDYPGLTERQEAMLEPPNARYLNRHPDRGI